MEGRGTGVGTLQGLRRRTVAKGASQCGKLAPAELRQCRPAWQRNRPPPKSLQEPATKPPNPPPCPGWGVRRDAGASLRWGLGWWVGVRCWRRGREERFPATFVYLRGGFFCSVFTYWVEGSLLPSFSFIGERKLSSLLRSSARGRSSALVFFSLRRGNLFFTW